MKNLVIVLILITCFSCKKETQIKKEKQIVEKENVVIVLSNPNQIKTNIGSGVDIKTLGRLDWNTLKKSDTIIFPINKFKRLYFRNNYSSNSITCANGDTILIKINENKINFSFSNRIKKKYDTLSLNELIKHNFKKENNLSLKYKNLFFNKNPRTGGIETNFEYIKNNRDEFKNFYISEREFLVKKNKLVKELFDKGLLSKSDFNSYKSRYKYEDYSSLINNYQITGDEYYKHLLNVNYFQNDSILNDDFFSYGYINLLIKKHILFDKFETRKKTEGLRFYEYKKAFDSLPKSVSGNWLKYAQFYCLSEIAKSNDEDVYIESLKKFQNNVNDSTLISIIKTDPLVRILKNKYLPNFSELKKESKNVYLINIDKDKLTLNEILKLNQGKLIYIDFWASWCAPCRSAMPASKKLQEDYKNKEVVFIYISIDKDFEEWKKATKEEKLLSKNNVLAINYPKANYFENLNVSTIPRYLLYDKSGQIVNQNAPRPTNEKEIRKLLDRYLDD